MWKFLNCEPSTSSAESAVYLSPLKNMHALLPIVKTTPSLKVSYLAEYNQVILTMPPYGMTSKLSPKSNLKPQSTSSQQDSLAKTCLVMELKRAWVESGADFSMRCLDLLMLYDQDSFSWKMSPTLPKKVSEKLQQKLPDCGMIVDGSLYQLPQLVPLTREKGGLCLPTLTCTDGTAGAVIGKADVYTVTQKGTVRRDIKTGQSTSLSLGRYVQIVPKGAILQPGTQIKNFCRGKLNPQWCEWLMNYQLDWTLPIGGIASQILKGSRRISLTKQSV